MQADGYLFLDGLEDLSIYRKDKGYRHRKRADLDEFGSRAGSSMARLLSAASPTTASTQQPPQPPGS
jgi:hypothetical protein